MPDTPPSLLIRLRDRDNRRSWQQFFEQYWRLIYSFARHCGLAPPGAEDVVQEVVSEVFEALPTFEYDRAKGTFRALLRKITQHKVADHLRRQARGRSIHGPVAGMGGNGHRPLADPAGSSAEQIWERDWRRNLLQACLDRVSREVEPKTFQAFQLYALEGWSVRDTAEFLGLSVASVYAAKSRIAQRVRDWWHKEIGDD